MQMDNFESTWLWAVELPPDLQQLQKKYKKKLYASQVNLDLRLAKKTDQYIVKRAAKRIDEFLQYKVLGILCHLINGFGNAIWKNKNLLDHLPRYIVGTTPSTYRIRQNAKINGDYHPWQIFTYCIMAGIPLTQKISKINIDLKTLAKNSNRISQNVGGEMGHLLFALAHMPEVKTLYLKNQLYTVEEIFLSALKEHRYEFYAVCRMIHLTEGTCAAAAKIPCLKKYRKFTQINLTTQLNKLFVVGLLLQEIKAELALRKVKVPQKNANAKKLARLLNLKNISQDIYHLVGHLVELAIFAEIFQYKISKSHWRIIYEILNQLNFYLCEEKIKIDLATLSHYRRAITLLSEVDKLKQNNSPASSLSLSSLAHYRVNFDRTSKIIRYNK